MKTPKSTPITQAIEQEKEYLLEQSVNENIMLTGCYQNFFESNINRAAHNSQLAHKENDEKVAAAINQDMKAWKRARELFFALAARTLRDLANSVADQVEQEFKNTSRITAADVSGELRHTTTAEILSHN